MGSYIPAPARWRVGDGRARLRQVPPVRGGAGIPGQPVLRVTLHWHRVPVTRVARAVRTAAQPSYAVGVAPSGLPHDGSPSSPTVAGMSGLHPHASVGAPQQQPPGLTSGHPTRRVRGTRVPTQGTSSAGYPHPPPPVAGSGAGSPHPLSRRGGSLSPQSPGRLSCSPGVSGHTTPTGGGACSWSLSERSERSRVLGSWVCSGLLAPRSGWVSGARWWWGWGVAA